MQRYVIVDKRDRFSSFAKNKDEVWEVVKSRTNLFPLLAPFVAHEVGPALDPPSLSCEEKFEMLFRAAQDFKRKYENFSDPDYSFHSSTAHSRENLFDVLFELEDEEWKKNYRQLKFARLKRVMRASSPLSET